jgi:hypothetical protein
MRFFRAPRDHLKFSIAHTFLVPLASFMASDRPSGDGIANSMLLLEWSSTEALPSSVTLSNALSRSCLPQETRRLVPPADQSIAFRPFHPFTTRSRVLPVEVERSRIVPWLGSRATMARCERSGDRLQLHSGSICGGA